MNTVDERLTAATTSGAVRGVREGGLTVFRGVPYAAPPVGERRWQPAGAHEPWAGVRDTTSDGPIASQSVRGPYRGILGDPSGGGPMGEDCLTLTIWTPAADCRRRPVMVWFHGGGFISGAGSWDIYSGAALAANGNAVVVGFNYRTGPLGYLYLGNDCPAGGNFGLTDQLLAVAWVRENIANFGGDPEQITLFGQSAGAWSIAAMLGLPEAPPVRRAILQSAPLASIGRSASEAERVTGLYLDTLGADSIEALRTVPSDELLGGVPGLMRHLHDWGSITFPFQPTLDGSLLPGPVVDRFSETALDVDLMIGWTRREMAFFYGPDPTMWDADRGQVTTALRRMYGDRAAASYRRYAAESPAAAPIDVLIAANGDQYFRAPALKIADQRTRSGRQTWVYDFDLPVPAAFGGRLDGCHCAELPFVFDTSDAWDRAGGGLFEGFDRRAHEGTARSMHTAWWTFARDGKPTGNWPPFGPERSIMRFA